MERKYYLAYGSNLHIRQMAGRCPDSRIEGYGYLYGWKLTFHTHANIEPQKGRRVPVGVWSISEKDEEMLDAYEGFPYYYGKVEVGITVHREDGTRQRIRGMAYVMTEDSGKRPPVLPPRSYWDILIEGYENFGFDTKYLWKALAETRKGGAEE